MSRHVKHSFSASSTRGHIERCKAILTDTTSVQDLPRSGPWAHHLINPRSLPSFFGRTEHPDNWRVSVKPSHKKHEMSRGEWETWHLQRANGTSRTLRGGVVWNTSNHVMMGHAFLPEGNSEATASLRPTSSSSSRTSSLPGPSHISKDSLQRHKPRIRGAGRRTHVCQEGEVDAYGEPLVEVGPGSQVERQLSMRQLNINWH
eukprot:CAMPEP_0196721280 /NCGR_PEP_ID=MMETSP1091-20130531/3899_1 /TAXON_ID=302021 /ORGANISM="Rhodomonas sp., Strain CCMP768" /LENGTH=202 /DNA_ID=CAMNT_0042062721 /DNA_START=148 /DNA_END=756 /DNA_ORIENTATION=+